MVMLWSARLAAVVSCLVLPLTAGSAVASAEPDLSPIINTTCTYPQVIAALNAQDKAAADQLTSSPTAQSMLQRFLASPPDQRQKMAQRVQGIPQAQQYFGTIQQVASTCNGY
jgi:hemophore-related protein